MNINTLQYYEPKSQLDNVLLTYTKHRLFKDNHAWLITRVKLRVNKKKQKANCGDKNKEISPHFWKEKKDFDFTLP